MRLETLKINDKKEKKTKKGKKYDNLAEEEETTTANSVAPLQVNTGRKGPQIIIAPNVNSTLPPGNHSSLLLIDSFRLGNEV